MIARLVATREGSQLSFDRPLPTALAMSAASAVIAAVALRETTIDVHLSAALAIEGVLLWCARPEARRAGQTHALTEGYSYAFQRFSEVQRSAPEALRRALVERGGGRR